MVRWLRTCLGRPSEVWRDSVDFWSRVTETTAAPPDADEVLLEPDTGDAWLGLTRRATAPPTRIDLVADDAEAMVSTAYELGATAIYDDNERFTGRSPGGLMFRVEAGDRAFTEPAIVKHANGSTSSANQLCIDIGRGDWDAEVRFWENLTGWNARTTSFPEFSTLTPEDRSTCVVLLQRLDEERPTGAHVDFSASDVASVVEVHKAAGARGGAVFPKWTVMYDPSGAVYCLTAVDPASGESTA